jgi:hypothetical protein
METILLRTLTGKSKLHFGKYAGLSIDQIINLGHTAYLRGLYFNISSINFTDEILNKIYIGDEFKITKPGINKDFELLCFKRVFGTAGKNKRYRIASQLKKNRKINFYNYDKKDRIKFSKASLTRRNHGHK